MAVGIRNVTEASVQVGPRPAPSDWCVGVYRVTRHELVKLLPFTQTHERSEHPKPVLVIVGTLVRCDCGEAAFVKWRFISTDNPSRTLTAGIFIFPLYGSIKIEVVPSAIYQPAAPKYFRMTGLLFPGSVGSEPLESLEQ